MTEDKSMLSLDKITPDDNFINLKLKLLPFGE